MVEILFAGLNRRQGVAGVAATLWNAASMLPFLGSDGKTAMDAIEAESPAIGIASFAAYVFAVRDWLT